jgi:cytochrome c peroxidase
MKRYLLGLLLTAGLLCVLGVHATRTPATSPPLGLPPVPLPEDNPQTVEKVALGDKLFHDARFSSTGDISCATCHDAEKAFTDSPLKVSEGIKKLTGTRNAPTVVNAVYFRTQFWDGRSPSLEDQALHPFVNPVEMGLKDHQPILDIVRTDPDYVDAFKKVFGTSGDAITMDEVTKAIAAFERTQVTRAAAYPATSSNRRRRFLRTIDSTISASASTGYRRTCRSSPASSSKPKRR